LRKAAEAIAPLAFTTETSDKTSTMFVELLDGLNRALAQLSKGVTGKQAIVDGDLPMLYGPKLDPHERVATFSRMPVFKNL
jgi:hypothetical protein